MTTQKIDVKKSLMQKPKFTTVMFLLGGLVVLGYYLLGALRFTDDAFVVQVSTPVTPRVAGVVTEVHVSNGQHVKAGDVLVSLDPTGYEQRLEIVTAQYQEALVALDQAAKQVTVAEHDLAAAAATLDTLKLQFKAKDHPSVRPGVSQIDMTQLKNQIKAQANEVDSLKVQIEIDKLNVLAREKQAMALRASMQEAQTALSYTQVTAATDGVIENVFLGVGTQVSPSAGMFTLVNNGTTFVQANYEETELVGVKAGDKATIYPRLYLGKKSFQGEVVANPFGVSRQMSDPFSGSPVVATENKWLLLPQRLPVIIKIIETDEKYPLVNGMSTYVRLQN
ncbi:MAG: biotin/lipoyl-binding protein [Burkholderiaceae bacterium]|nr:biotin/lipoyl-binding protein [Burkholderiaceae bacterium]MCD8564219.1 biotin/lipoyl-binding protein [Burkholderiaceae bacterium]